MHLKFVFILIIFSCSSIASSQIFCSDLLKRNRTKFHPVRHCQRSNKTRIAAKNVADLSKCIQLAENNQAMAFNFGHGKKPRKKSGDDFLNLFDVMRDKEENRTAKTDKDMEIIEPYFNCEVLSCPEVGNMSSLINDTRYDYYSMYGNAPQNATCFPTVGLLIYYYSERMNYTDAADTCMGHRGYLAQIISDERTNFMSFLIQKQIEDLSKTVFISQSSFNDSLGTPPMIPIRHAFIGLQEMERKGNFVNSLDIPIQCYRYRAWAPKYPSYIRLRHEGNRLGCVAITASKSWKMFDCRKRMPFFCELKPTKPKRFKRRKFRRRCSLKRNNN